MQKAERSVADLVVEARDTASSIAGQHAAFTLLVERFEAMAFATARAALRDPELARDACQAAFLSAWRKLPQLRDPSAFGLWLKRLVRTQCARERRRRFGTHETGLAATAELPTSADADPALLAERGEWQRDIRRAIDALPDAQREVVKRFHLDGQSLRAIAAAMGLTVSRVGKLAYSGRLRLRRSLPKPVTEGLFMKRLGPAFVARVQDGIFDEFAGRYHFPERPDHPVLIRREGGRLTSDAGGQRNVLISRNGDSLEPLEFDGEACFGRDENGRITHFVYYEFGKRRGVAYRVDSSTSAQPLR